MMVATAQGGQLLQNRLFNCQTIEQCMIVCADVHRWVDVRHMRTRGEWGLGRPGTICGHPLWTTPRPTSVLSSVIAVALLFRCAYCVPVINDFVIIRLE